MTPTITVNLNIGLSGAVPTPPATINANYIAAVAADNSGYTILPGGLIEDLSSTATFAIYQIDSLVVDLVNSFGPNTSNGWLTVQLGQIYGVQQGLDTNTSVFVIFTGTVGFLVQPGFTVSDGTHQYRVVEGGPINTGGSTQPLFCVAIQSGSWPVPAATVTQLVSAVPVAITLSCTNALAGTPSAGAQTLEDYRAQVLQAGLVSGQGNPSMAKALIAQVPGVQPRLVAIKQIDAGGWEVIVGGTGDPYQVAAAVYQAGLDISTLVGSTIAVTAITAANPGVITVDVGSGLTNGQNNVHIAGVTGTMGATLNGGPYTITVTGQTATTTSFSIAGKNTTGETYLGGGVVTPNPRNVTVNLDDYPDTYSVPLVIPPLQTVTVQLTWNTDSPNFVSDTAMAAAGGPAIANYINSVPVGAPVNVFELQNVFQAATAGLLATQLLTRMVFTISINGVSTAPDSGTEAVEGDPESYFSCLSSAVTITQG